MQSRPMSRVALQRKHSRGKNHSLIMKAAELAKYLRFTHIASVAARMYGSTYYHVISVDDVIRYGWQPATVYQSKTGLGRKGKLQKDLHRDIHFVTKRDICKLYKGFHNAFQDYLSSVNLDVSYEMRIAFATDAMGVCEENNEGVFNEAVDLMCKGFCMGKEQPTVNVLTNDLPGEGVHFSYYCKGMEQPFIQLRLGDFFFRELVIQFARIDGYLQRDSIVLEGSFDLSEVTSD